jgi:hypothetical protein
MTTLGWSLPAGCDSLPGEQVSAISILPFIQKLPDGVEDVVWDEDNNIIEGRKQDDDICLLWVAVAMHAWKDDASFDDNMTAAASTYTARYSE